MHVLLTQLLSVGHTLVQRPGVGNKIINMPVPCQLPQYFDNNSHNSLESRTFRFAWIRLFKGIKKDPILRRNKGALHKRKKNCVLSAELNRTFSFVSTLCPSEELCVLAGGEELSTRG